MSAPLASARCLDSFCPWLSDEQGLALLGGEAQRHADQTGHAVYLTYTIPARPGCDPVCRCSSADLDRNATDCAVHGRA